MKRIDYNKQFKWETPVILKYAFQFHITYECLIHSVYKRKHIFL